MEVLRMKMSIENMGAVRKAQAPSRVDNRPPLGVLENLKKSQSQTRTPETSDSEIPALWSSLRSEIRMISVDLFGKAFPGHDVSVDADNLQPKFEELTPHWKSMWERPEFKEYLFQALIWRFIAKRILGDNTAVLGPEYGAMATLIKEKVGLADEFHAWRANTVALLRQGRCGITASETKKLASELVQDLFGGNADSATPDIRHRLQKIITSAAQLALAFLQSRCDYQFAFEDPTPTRPVTFRRVSMEMMSALETRCQFDQVLLVLSPSLRKYGTPSGDRYNVNTLVYKAGVFGGVRDLNEFRRRCVEA